jgi:hypothetical protein
LRTGRFIRPLLLTLALGTAAPARGAEDAGVDTALIVSVDVSGSVDDRRYALQMDGIAAALEETPAEPSMQLELLHDRPMQICETAPAPAACLVDKRADREG